MYIPPYTSSLLMYMVRMRKQDHGTHIFFSLGKKNIDHYSGGMA